MIIRTALALAASAAAVAVAVAAAPAAADAHTLLAAPPVHARPGACYAHVRSAARYAPPPGPHGAWRLTPGAPGEPGPRWCFVSVPGGPPVLLSPGRDGWVRVPCAPRPRPHPRPHPRVRPVAHHVRHHPVVHHHRPRPHPAPPPHVCCVRPPPPPCCLRPTTPPPPPVVILRAPNPAAYYGQPGPHVLHWGGKTGG